MRRLGMLAVLLAVLLQTATSVVAQEAADADRLAGATRFGTSVEISQAAFPDGAPTAYLARAHAPLVDALAGGVLRDGPILLVPGCGPIPDEIATELQRLTPDTVTALGGTTAICDQQLTDAATATGATPDRLAGPTRYATAVAISQAAFPDGAPTAYLARAHEPLVDALAGGVLRDGPILLVPPSGPVPEQVLSEVERVGPSAVVALGGTAAIGQDVLEAAARRGGAREPAVGDVGETIVVGTQGGGQLEVTLVELVDPAPPDEFSDPDGRLVAVELYIENAGPVEYDDAPGNTLTLIDAANRQHTTEFDTTTACSGFASGLVRLLPGDARRGCLTFDVPESASLREIQFRADSGFGPQTARWDVTGYASGSAPERGDLQPDREPSLSVGQGAVLRTNDDGVRVRVTPTRVVDPATGDEFSDPNGRFVAIELELTNTGTSSYEGYPSNDVLVVDGLDRGYTDVFDEVNECGRFEGGSVQLAPGESRVGCLVFDVPTGVATSRVQIALDSGYGPDVGVWSLR